MLSRHSTLTLVQNYGKAKLLDILKSNRDKHHKQYEEAVSVYRRELVAILENKLAAAKASKVVCHQIRLDLPVHFLGEYDRAIKMLEMSDDAIIQLDPNMFAQFVEDNWDWKHEFANSTVKYTQSGGGVASEGV